ncbi:MAG TPA: AraC family transcriptional regulator [Trinickia sp.]
MRPATYASCTRFRAAHSCSNCRRWYATVDTSLALAEIASQCGYADQSHFSRTFSARTSSTPTRYRRTRSPKRTAVAVPAGGLA